MRRVTGWTAYWVLFGSAMLALLGSIGAVLTSTRMYTLPNNSMANTVQLGDRVLVVKETDVRRGDVVVFTLPPRLSGGSLMERVIGLPGDHVACCDAQGRVTVNGIPLNETSYLYPDNQPSRFPFSITLGSGQVWMMADHRDISVDSRINGPAQVSAITGRVVVVIHGWHWTWLHTPAAFTAAGLAPADTRTIELWPLVTAAVCILMIVVLGLYGIIQLIRRHRATAPTGNPIITK